jgi:hypothetical protein
MKEVNISFSAGNSADTSAANATANVVRDTIRIGDSSSIYTEIKKGASDGWNESESHNSVSGIADLLVPLTFFIATAFVLTRLIDYKRSSHISMIEHGMDPSLPAPRNDDDLRIYSSLRRGLILLGSGLGLIIGYMVPVSGNADGGLISFATCVIGGGIGYVVYFLIARKNSALDKTSARE